MNLSDELSGKVSFSKCFSFVANFVPTVLDNILRLF